MEPPTQNRGNPGGEPDALTNTSPTIPRYLGMATAGQAQPPEQADN